MTEKKKSDRRGIACAGNWIVDHVKIVDVWPQTGNLSNILDEQSGTGGSPFNLCIDLARLEPSLPLEAIGRIGADKDGQWIARQLGAKIDTSQLRPDEEAPTSYTDVMTVQLTGERTFFHMRGANARFDVDDVDLGAIESKIFVLGYLLLLDRLDAPHDEFGTRAAHLLARCRRAGMATAIDLVSAQDGRFQKVVAPALRHVDYCIINEVEAGGVTELDLRAGEGEPDWDAIKSAAVKLAELGAARNVTIHLPEGAVSLDVVESKMVQLDSLPLPDGFIKGSAGAGDAFFSGMLLGLHEGWPLERSLELAHGAAAASLRHATCTGGMGSIEEVLKLATDLRGEGKREE